MPPARGSRGASPAIASMWAGWFRLKSCEQGTAHRGTAFHHARASAGTSARRAVADAAVAVAAYLVAGIWLGTVLVAEPAFWWLALVAGAAVIVRAASSVLGRVPRFSTPADRVTLGRAAVVACCAAVTAWDLFTGPGTHGLIVVLGSAAFLLDAADGRVARLTGSATAEGARLDSDTDATLVLVLSCAAAGSFGPWPLGIGLMYYVFLAAGWFQPSLKIPLPSSTLRKVIWAIQPAALLFALLPGVPVWPGSVALGAALGLLVYSFGRDVVGLERLRRADPARGNPVAAAERRPGRTAEESAGDGSSRTGW